MSFTKIDSTKLNSRGATILDNKPQISASALKMEFDAPAKQVVAPAFNELVDELESETAAASLGAVSPSERVGGSTVQGILNKLSSDLENVENDSHTHSNLPLLEMLTGDVVMDPDYVHTDNNYTDDEKDKLEGIEDNANNYVLPVATDESLGGVKADGTSTRIDPDGTIHAENTGVADTFKTISVNGTDIEANGEDTLVFEQGANVTITPDPVTKKIRIAATGGGSGGGGGDMYMSTYDSNGDGIVNSADTINGLTASVNELNFVKGATSNIQGQIDPLKNKTQNLDANGKLSAANVLDSNNTPIDGKLTLLDGVVNSPEDLSVEQTSSSNKLATAYAIQKYANKYTERIEVTIPADENTIGIWQNEDDPSSWIVDDDHMLILPQLYEADDEKLEFTFLFDSTCNQAVYLGGYQYVPQTVNGSGENCGAICVMLANYPTVNINVAIDVTHLREVK